MRFQVPQFIEIEDKIFGPITIKQFVYLAGGCGLAFILWRVLPTFIGIIVDIPILVFSIALAFFKVNNKPFIYIVEAAFKYIFTNKLYIWHKTPRTPESMMGKMDSPEDKEVIEYAKIMVPKISDSKLRDLTWSLDIKESMYKDTKHTH